MSAQYDLVADAITFLTARAAEQPSLEALAQSLGVSPFHLQRTFKRYAGVTPKQFLAALTLERAKASLDDDESVLDAALDAGLSSPSRLHDHFVTLQGVTPGEYKSGGSGIAMRYGTARTPFGQAAVATTERGIALFEFIDRQSAYERVRDAWPGATLHPDDTDAQRTVDAMFAEPHEPISLFVRGTNFQVRVWHALLQISPGSTTDYASVAREIGQPTAARAVGNALASNRIALLIPCHRVLARSGVLGNYRWGSERKRALLAWERANAVCATSAHRRVRS